MLIAEETDNIEVAAFRSFEKSCYPIETLEVQRSPFLTKETDDI